MLPVWESVPTVNERLAILEEQVRSTIKHRERLFSLAESIGGRVTRLEETGRTLKVVADTLAEVKNERHAAQIERDGESRWRFANAWKAIAALTALLAVALPYVTHLGWFG